MRRTPLTPLCVACQKASRPTPFGLMAPIPVMTTRRVILEVRSRKEAFSPRAQLGKVVWVHAAQRGGGCTRGHRTRHYRRPRDAAVAYAHVPLGRQALVVGAE